MGTWNPVSDTASNKLSDEYKGSGVEAVSSGTIAFEDAALVEATKKGDMQAYASLVVKYQHRLFNMLCRMCARQADAEELAQEAFLKALERIGQFRGHSRFYTWLFRIAANLAISHRRRSGRIKFSPLNSGDDDAGQTSALMAEVSRRRSVPPEAEVMSKDTSRRVLDAIEQLDDEYRLVVVLRDIEDMDYAGIAQVLAIPAGTVKSRLHRARCILRDRLMDLV